MDGSLTASDVALLTGNNRNDGMFGGDAHGGLSCFSCSHFADGETTAGAIMATAVDMQPRQLLRQIFREDLIIPL